MGLIPQGLNRIFYQQNYRIGLKLCQGRIIADTMRRFFMQRGIGHCNRLPNNVVITQSLAEFKKHLENALSSWYGSQGFPGQGQQLDTTILVGPVQLERFYASNFHSTQNIRVIKMLQEETVTTVINTAQYCRVLAAI